MAVRENITNRNLGCVAGLFHSDSAAENAMKSLKQAGFSEFEIGIATAGHTKKEGFWDNIKQSDIRDALVV